MTTAPKREKFLYEEDDLVDDFFFDELAKHIVPTKLTALVKHLDLPEAMFEFLQDFLILNTSVQWVSITAILYYHYFLNSTTLYVIIYLDYENLD